MRRVRLRIHIDCHRAACCGIFSSWPLAPEGELLGREDGRNFPDRIRQVYLRRTVVTAVATGFRIHEPHVLLAIELTPHFTGYPCWLKTRHAWVAKNYWLGDVLGDVENSVLTDCPDKVPVLVLRYRTEKRPEALFRGIVEAFRRTVLTLASLRDLVMLALIEN